MIFAVGLASLSPVEFVSSCFSQLKDGVCDSIAIGQGFSIRFFFPANVCDRDDWAALGL